MRKIFIAIIMMLATVGSMAQTEFRTLSYQEAMAAAKTEGKLVFLDFYAVWCAPCKAMTENEFVRPRVGDFMNKHFISVQIDGEKGEGIDLVEKYKLSGYPTMIVIDPNEEKEITRVNGFMEGNELVQQLAMYVDPNKNPVKLKERYDAGERSAEFIKTYCNVLSKMKDKNPEVVLANQELAHDIAQDYFTHLSEDEKISWDNAFVIQEYTKYSEDPAFKYMEEYIDDFDPRMAPRIEQIIEEVYEGNIKLYLNGSKPFREDAYRDFRKNFIEKGYDKKVKNSEAAWGLIEAYGTGNLDTYLDYLDKHLGELDADQLHIILLDFDHIVYKGTPKQKERAVQLWRNKLPVIDTQSMYYVTTFVKKMRGSY